MNTQLQKAIKELASDMVERMFDEFYESGADDWYTEQATLGDDGGILDTEHEVLAEALCNAILENVKIEKDSLEGSFNFLQDNLG